MARRTSSRPWSRTQAVEDGFRECADCNPLGSTVTEVWIVDGRPDYHAEDCSRAQRDGRRSVPRAEAIADGRSACDRCNPDGLPLAEPEPDTLPEAANAPTAEAASESAAEPATADSAAQSGVPSVAAAPGDVWVVDGRPRYHLESCLIIKDQDAEAIPRDHI